MDWLFWAAVMAAELLWTAVVYVLGRNDGWLSGFNDGRSGMGI